ARLKPCPSQTRPGKSRRLLLPCHSSTLFFAGLPGIASSNLFVPCRMKGPSPRFADRAAGHRLKSARLAEGALINVDEDSAQHDERGDVVEHVADGDRNSSKCPRARPQHDASDQVNHAPDQDLPELNFLAGIEESGIWRLHFFFAADDLVDVPHPVGIGCRPDHRLKPVQRLQCEEENKAHAEPGMHGATELASAEDGRKPAEQPGQVDAEASEQSEKKEQRHHPMENARVHGMAEQLSAVDGGLAYRLEVPADLF